MSNTAEGPGIHVSLPLRHSVNDSSDFLSSQPSTNASSGLRRQEVILQRARSAPVGPVTYTFSQLGYNSMLVIPPSESQDNRPVYHITVEMNCLRPTSYITVIRRGASDRGHYVGEFECQ